MASERPESMLQNFKNFTKVHYKIKIDFLWGDFGNFVDILMKFKLQQVQFIFTQSCKFH